MYDRIASKWTVPYGKTSLNLLSDNIFNCLLCTNHLDYEFFLFLISAQLTSLIKDHVHPILPCWDQMGQMGWTMPRGRLHVSWLRQVESIVNDMGMAGLASAWAMARRRPNEYRRKVDAATRCSGVRPLTIPDLNIVKNVKKFHQNLFS